MDYLTAANEPVFDPCDIARQVQARITDADLALSETDLEAYRQTVHAHEQQVLAELEQRRLKNIPTHTRPRTQTKTSTR